MKPPRLLRALSLLSLLALAIATRVPSARADDNPPERMSYQGFLTDANNLPLGNTNTGPKNYDVIFRIYNDPSAGTPGSPGDLWVEQQTVTVDRGYFSLLLGEGVAVTGEPHNGLSSVFTNIGASDRYIEMTVKGIGAGSPPADVVILPRTRLVTSPYAFLARNAVSAANLVNVTNGSVVSVSGSNVGVNTSSPGSALDVNGTLTTKGLRVTGGLGDVLLGPAANPGLWDFSIAPAFPIANRLSWVSDGSGWQFRIAVSNKVSITVTDQVTITDNGNVGIGTTSPTNKLDVQGNISATGTVSGFGTIPIGGIIMWSGAVTNIPAGWALCNGQTTNGVTTPDLRGRFVLGTTPGVPTRAPGQPGGEENHTLTVDEMPGHTHPLTVKTVGYGAVYNNSAEATSSPTGRNNGDRTYTPSSTGGGLPHNNMPPYLCLAYIMRVQ